MEKLQGKGTDGVDNGHIDSLTERALFVEHFGFDQIIHQNGFKFSGPCYQKSGVQSVKKFGYI